MAKNRSAAGITNIVQYDANRNITFVSGSTTLLTVSSSGALTTTGTITATTLVVQTVTSSVNFITGSTKFGSLSSNTHTFTGSLNVTGAFYIPSGSVGIGTTSPASPLNVIGAIRSSNSGNTISTRIESDGLYTAGSDMYIDAGTSNIRFYSTSERMRITTSGSLLVGSSTAKWPGIKGVELNAAETIYGMVNGSTALGYIYHNGAHMYISNELLGSNDMVFNVNGAARMRIYSTGNISCGTNIVDSGFKFYMRSTAGMYLETGAGSGDTSFQINDVTGGNIYFRVRGDGLVLSPTTYNVTTATAANLNIGTAGDFRRSTSSIKYKTDVINYDKGLAEVMQMRPVYYKGINDGDTQFAGLIAEEVHDLGLTEFVQYAEDGTPDAIYYANMIALMTKAIQELKSQNDSLQQQINELKA